LFVRLIRFGTIAAMLLTPWVASGQSAATPAKPAAAAKAPAPSAPFKPARTPDGQPDISGIYIAIPLTMGIETARVPAKPRTGPSSNREYSFNLNERPAAAPGTEKRPVVADPRDGIIPLSPWGLEKRKEIIAHQNELLYLDGRVLCLAPGIPRTQMPAPVVGYQIFQKPGYVVIFYEQSHLYRVIPLDSRPVPKNIRKSMGVSRGRWEGTTLVVDVTNFTTNFPLNDWVIGQAAVPEGIPGESLTSGHGIPRTEDYRVVERYIPIDADTIRYEATIHDPKVYTQPWTVAYDAMKRAPADYVPVEYACHEGNERNIELMIGVDTTKVRLAVP
jgi:hypothetical protein